MAKTKALKRPAVVAPQDKREADLFLHEAGETARELEKLGLELDQRVADLRRRAGEQIAPLQEELREKVDGLSAWASTNRAELTDGGQTKTVKLPSGEVGWRTTPRKVVIRDEEEVIARLKKLGLDRYLRPKVEVNKQAILDDPSDAQGVKGIKIDQHEDFFVKPEESAKELIASEVRKLKVPA